MELRRTTWRLAMVHVGAIHALSMGVACSPAAPSNDDSSDSEVDSSDAVPDGAPDVSDAGCPREAPDACPSPMPSWMSEVEPIVERTCNPCHGVGGVERPAHDFSTYAGVYKEFGSIYGVVLSCLMPPPDAGALTPAERQTLLAWLICRAPNN